MGSSKLCGIDTKVAARQLTFFLTIIGGAMAVVEYFLQWSVAAGYFTFDKSWFWISIAILCLRPLVRTRSAFLSAFRTQKSLFRALYAAIIELVMSALLLDVILALRNMACKSGRGRQISESVKVLGEKSAILMYTSIPLLLLNAYIVILQFTTTTTIPTANQGASICVSVASVAFGVSPGRWIARTLGREGKLLTYAFMALTLFWTLLEVSTRTLAVALFACGYKGWVFVALALEYIIRLVLLSGFKLCGCGHKRMYEQSDVFTRALRQLLAHEVTRGDDANHHCDRFLFIALALGIQACFILGPAFNDILPVVQPPLAGVGIVPPPVVSGTCWLEDYRMPNTEALFKDVVNSTLLAARCNHGPTWGNLTSAAWLAANSSHTLPAPLVVLAGDAAFKEVHKLPAIFVVGALFCSFVSFVLYAVWQVADGLYDVPACSSRARAAKEHRKAEKAAAEAEAAAAAAAAAAVAGKLNSPSAAEAASHHQHSTSSDPLRSPGSSP